MGKEREMGHSRQKNRSETRRHGSVGLLRRGRSP